MYRILIILGLFGTLSLSAQFTGGTGDGHDYSRTTQSDLAGVPAGIRPLYGGGPGDGHDRARFNAGYLEGGSLTVLYGGGRGDGHDHRLYSAAGLNGSSLLVLYGGGSGDGHDQSLYPAAGLDGSSLLALFAGGSGDGHDVAILLSATIPLPLTLVRFDATDHGTYVLLEWETEDEVDTDYFTVERTADGVDVTEVGQLAAAGYSAPGERRAYQLRDETPWTGTRYYRLRVTDFDGAASFSDLVAVNRTGATAEWDFSLYPNPGTGTHFYLAPAGLAGRLEVTVFDSQGKRLAVETIDGDGGDQEIVLPRRLPPGTYVIRATDDRGHVRVKLLLVGR